MLQNSNILILFVQLSTVTVSLCIVIFFMCKIIETKNRINKFTGNIVETKYFRHYECPTCGHRINIHKEKICKQCGCKLFSK